MIGSERWGFLKRIDAYTSRARHGPGEEVRRLDPVGRVPQEALEGGEIVRRLAF